MSKHIPSEKQELAFKKVIQAIKAAEKSGLVFYAKSSKLVAYTKAADNYIENEIGFSRSLRGSYGQLYNLNASVLQDSGADDYGSYITQEDSDKYNPDKY